MRRRFEGHWWAGRGGASRRGGVSPPGMVGPPTTEDTENTETGRRPSRVRAGFPRPAGVGREPRKTRRTRKDQAPDLTPRPPFLGREGGGASRRGAVSPPAPVAGRGQQAALPCLSLEGPGRPAGCSGTRRGPPCQGSWRGGPRNSWAGVWCPQGNSNPRRSLERAVS